MTRDNSGSGENRNNRGNPGLEEQERAIKGTSGEAIREEGRRHAQPPIGAQQRLTKRRRAEARRILPAENRETRKAAPSARHKTAVPSAAAGRARSR